MSDLDRTPTPPPDDQELPPRPFPFVPQDGQVALRSTVLPDVVAMIYDSGDVRVVSYWTHEALAALANRMLTFVGEAPITVADLDDLRGLRDASPFIEP